jgi:dolichol kinase
MNWYLWAAADGRVALSVRACCLAGVAVAAVAAVVAVVVAGVASLIGQKSADLRKIRASKRWRGGTLESLCSGRLREAISSVT